MTSSNIERGRFHPSFVASADITEGYLAVKLTGEGKVATADADDKVIGILSERGAKKTGEAVGVLTEGNVVATYGATITAGQALQVADGGKLIPLTTGDQVAVAFEDGVENETHQVKIEFNHDTDTVE
ncbi:MAG: hypothetical protein LBG52_06965 [Candidatus Peribacteria bacterium]|jgi:hypothetical protein|nr:hypothetical protein [Candidatus Peribacteria bacterium]